MIGTINYAVESGLGIQTKSFIDNGVIDKIFVWEHSSYPRQNWYTKDQVVSSVDELLNTCSTLFFMETPFDWKVILKAREKGIKTVLMAMHECTQWPFPYYPDVLVGGSLSEVELYKRLGSSVPCVHINAPVQVPWKLRKKALTFVHNSGHGGLGGRNGTKELLEAMKYVKSPIRLLLRTQIGSITSDDPRIEVVNRSVPYNELWSKGDVAIILDKFSGSSLPLQEAYASGLMPLALDRFPLNTWLPKECLVPVKGYKKERIGVEFDCAVIDPIEVAKKIDEIYNQNIESISKIGKKWAQENSWEVLGPKFKALCK